MDSDSAIEISAEELARLTTEVGTPPPAPGIAAEPAVVGMGDTSIPKTGLSQPDFGAADQVTVQSAAFMPLQATDPPLPADQDSKIGFLLDISMRISVELGRTRMDIRDILGLTTGSVVELDRQAGEPVDILINGHLVAQGEVVVIDDKFGVRVTDIESPMRRVHSLR